jgi:hypothetical protein
VSGVHVKVSGVHVKVSGVHVKVSGVHGSHAFLLPFLMLPFLFRYGLLLLSACLKLNLNLFS